jgi:hypothetical protein
MFLVPSDGICGISLKLLGYKITNYIFNELPGLGVMEKCASIKRHQN